MMQLAIEPLCRGKRAEPSRACQLDIKDHANSACLVNSLLSNDLAASAIRGAGRRMRKTCAVQTKIAEEFSSRMIAPIMN
jgi:hypothetical protein